MFQLFAEKKSEKIWFNLTILLVACPHVPFPAPHIWVGWWCSGKLHFGWDMFPRFSGRVLFFFNTHRIHGTGIFTIIYLTFKVDLDGFHVGKYTSPMDPLEHGWLGNQRETTAAAPAKLGTLWRSRPSSRIGIQIELLKMAYISLQKCSSGYRWKHGEIKHGLGPKVWWKTSDVFRSKSCCDGFRFWWRESDFRKIAVVQCVLKKS